MKLSDERKQELAFFLNDKGKVQYNGKCTHCVNDCKQSFKAEVIRCKNYVDRQAKIRQV